MHGALGALGVVITTRNHGKLGELAVISITAKNAVYFARPWKYLFPKYNLQKVPKNEANFKLFLGSLLDAQRYFQRNLLPGRL